MLAFKERGSRKDGVYRIPGQHQYDGMFFSPFIIPSELERIKNDLQLNEKDVISSAYLKTGSTWVNEIIYLICNDADVEKSSRLSALQKLPFLEFNMTRTPLQVATIEAQPSPRLLKSHLPARYFQRNFDKLDRGPKVIVTMRNPKDNLVSLFHFYRMNPGLGCFDGDWNEFFELFKNRQLMNEFVFDVNATWWKLRDHPNVHIVKYENLKSDPAEQIARMAAFLGYQLSSDHIATIVEATSFENMKKSEALSEMFKANADPDLNFFRKGKVGGWRDYFTEEQNNYIDQLSTQIYQPIGLAFDY